MIVDRIGDWDHSAHGKRDIDEAISELEREIGIRGRCFDRWVSEGKLSFVDARDRMERLISAMGFLRAYQEAKLKVEYLKEASEDVKAKSKKVA